MFSIFEITEATKGKTDLPMAFAMGRKHQFKCRKTRPYIYILKYEYESSHRCFSMFKKFR